MSWAKASTRSRGPSGSTSGPATTNVRWPKEQRALVEMGFDSQAVTAALVRTNDALDVAMSVLLGESPATTNSTESNAPSPPSSNLQSKSTWGTSGSASATSVKLNSALNGTTTRPQLLQRSQGVRAPSATLPSKPPIMTKTGTTPLGSESNTMTKAENIEAKHRHFMSTFKTTRCKDKNNHDKKMCSYFHSKSDKRRDPYEIEYSCSECPEHTEYTNCKDGDQCLKSHNMLERMFHPDLFKISMCQKPHSCERGQLCAFAHSE